MTENDKNNSKSDAALREEKVLAFWQENKIFEKSLSQREGKKEFVFYEGPPTANGKPGIHHIEARAFKDAIPRYKTMQGYHVRRKGGWDTQGLPVELQVEKQLGLNSKKAIEGYGIAKFNQECRKSVWEYVDLWYKFTDRIGFWLDEKNAYVTYHNDFIESVWNIVQKINEQKLLYKDYKVLPWCPRCETALSSHELAQGYQDDKDLSVTVKFKLLPNQKFGENKITKDTAYILAWTTTPWTLPGNVALAVGENIKYTALRIVGVSELYILATDRVKDVFKDQKIEIVHDDIKGKDLIGLEYEPLYPYLENLVSNSERPKLDKAYKVYAADFVNTEDGTGIVHTAVMYGQDDFILGVKIGLPKHHLVNPEGKFIKGTGFLEGKFVKDEETAVEIIKDLAHRGLLFKKEKYEHSYPHCWRCKTALIYYARDSWYIRMSDPKIKQEMIDENQKINWEPAYIRDGRFGEWLREIKDWAVSRERYWGTPLPVWDCAKCNQRQVIGSIQELKEKTKKSGNKYFVMRHGESESNFKNGIICCNVNDKDSLTDLGKKQIMESVKSLKDNKIDIIISSDFARTRETAEIVKNELNVGEEIVLDKRLREFNVGEFEGKTWKEYDAAALDRYNYIYTAKGGESWKQMRERVLSFVYEVEKKYKDTNILIVSHAAPIRVLFASVESINHDEVVKKIKNKEFASFNNAEIKILDFVPVPHNENYELDLHRPYIDEIKLVCTHSTGSGQACGGDLVRTKEVMDVWFDSGAMPFAEDHYPFENQKLIDQDGGYPADFISEAIDQTRGWFYTLHAIGVLMGRGRAYKNVICLGHLMDAVGKKMSKSVGNIVDPWEAINKYGVDTLRLWMYSVNQPGESKNFDENTVRLLQQQVLTLLYNVLAFYELYRDKNLETRNYNPETNSNVLDVWILARLNELTNTITENLDNYRLLEPVRAIRDFIGDLSTWYLRRSRERIKDESSQPASAQGYGEARATLYFVLKTLAKLMAPFAPFTAEDIWLKLRNANDAESVHLTEWPAFAKAMVGEAKVLEDMKQVREIVSFGLEARQKEQIPVRQPLASLILGADFNLPKNKDLLELVKDEINVKEVIFPWLFHSETNPKMQKIVAINSVQVKLDTKITPELKQEGDYRELVRALQDMRKKMGLTPSDVIALSFKTDKKGRKLIEKFEKDMKKTVLVSTIEIKEDDGKKSATCTRQEIKIDGLVFRVKIIKPQ